MSLDKIPGWQIVDNHHLNKTFKFKDFLSALAFVNQVGEIAEAQNHHPDIYLTWGQVKLDIFTHTENGITQKDYKLAEAIEMLH